MSLTISERTEALLAEEARRQGVSIDADAHLEKLIRESVAGASAHHPPPELPVSPVGVIGSLHRRDIYNDVP
jgi:hypothetical protein